MYPLIASPLLGGSSVGLELGSVSDSAWLIVLFGAMVGLSLGLTGGGGSIFAVPMLVYGLSVRPREAIGISLAAVGATALVGALRRLTRGEVEVRIGLLFAVSGMLGAPVGAWLGGQVPERILLGLFAGLMVAVAVRMWVQANRKPEEARAMQAALDSKSVSNEGRGPACRRDEGGRFRLTSRCFLVLMVSGLLAGVLAGLFGVGGGFVIVPALVLVAGMDIHRAVATSLLVIALISASGVASYLAAGHALPLELMALFLLGGLGGMELGTRWGRRLGGPGLQKLFASAMVVVAVFIVVKTFV